MFPPNSTDFPDTLEEGYRRLFSMLTFLQMLEKTPNQGFYMANMSRKISGLRKAGSARFPGTFNSDAYISLDAIINAAIGAKIREFMGLPSVPDLTEGMEYIFSRMSLTPFGEEDLEDLEIGEEGE